MATAINLRDLHYPDEEAHHQIMFGNWPSLLPHQWAILVGHPSPFTSWDFFENCRDKDAKPLTREDYEKMKRRQKNER